MIRVRMLLLLPLTVLLMGNKPVSPTGNYVVTAGKVITRPGEPRFIAGEFRVVKVAGAPVAMLRGGACLIRQRTPVTTCTTDKQCDITQGGVTSVGYCAAEASAPGLTPAPKTCWNKPPISDFRDCVKSPTEDLQTNHPYQTPWVASKASDQRRWRVATCQSITPGGCAKPLRVEGVDYLAQYGPASTH